MQTAQYRRWGNRAWLGLLVGAIICSLTLSLATRFCQQDTLPAHVAKTVERQSVEAKRQQFIQDAIRWVAPRTSCTLLEPIGFYSRVVFDETLPSSHRFDDSLYNRPPPVLSSFAL